MHNHFRTDLPYGVHSFTVTLDVGGADPGTRVPEPGTVGLLSLALAGLGTLRRRWA